MIHDVDETIRTLIREDALPGSEADVVFDAPTKEWSSRRNAPTLDVYLYDIREDLRRRETGRIDTHDREGRITGRRRPPRHYKLSYLVTAWTQRPEDEHRLLASVLACFNRHDMLPAEFLVGQLANLTLPVPVTIALPPPEDRALSDVWSALGGELKPSLDLVITLPLDTQVFDPAAELVTEVPRIRIASGNGTAEEPKGGKKGRSAATGAASKGAAGKAGREGSGAGRDDSTGAGGVGGGAGAAGGAGRREDDEIDETVIAGTEEHPGRTLHIRNRTERGK